MAQIIVSPKEQRIFARELEGLVRDVRQIERRLASEMEALGGTWKDVRYRSFARSVTTASVQLQIFYNSSLHYAEFLRRKAAAAERFLRT